MLCSLAHLDNKVVKWCYVSCIQFWVNIMLTEPIWLTNVTFTVRAATEGGRTQQQVIKKQHMGTFGIL